MLWPEHVYSGAKARVEVWLANEDVLAPGEYPVHVQMVAPDGKRAWERTASVHVPGRLGNVEAPLALPVVDEEVAVSGPGGAYRCVATLERGGAPTGGESVLHVTAAAAMPPVEQEITIWGEDAELAAWLAAHDVRVWTGGGGTGREVILVGRKPEQGGTAAFRGLAERIAHGSGVVFLCPEVFAEGEDHVRWLPLHNKGALGSIYSWLYLKDDWARAHPIFDGLPAGGLLDHAYYRELITQAVWERQDPPLVAVAGAVKASQYYASGLTISVNALGAGRFLLNTLDIRGQLGRHPAAERLLRNMLRFAALGCDQPVAALPADWERTLEAMRYR
jgi:hypothetical protein